jgi:hypothetical protein
MKKYWNMTLRFDPYATREYFRNCVTDKDPLDLVDELTKKSIEEATEEYAITPVIVQCREISKAVYLRHCKPDGSR